MVAGAVCTPPSRARPTRKSGSQASHLTPCHPISLLKQPVSRRVRHQHGDRDEELGVTARREELCLEASRGGANRSSEGPTRNSCCFVKKCSVCMIAGDWKCRPLGARAIDKVHNSRLSAALWLRSAEGSRSRASGGFLLWEARSPVAHTVYQALLPMTSGGAPPWLRACQLKPTPCKIAKKKPVPYNIISQPCCLNYTSRAAHESKRAHATTVVETGPVKTCNEGVRRPVTQLPPQKQASGRKMRA